MEFLFAASLNGTCSIGSFIFSPNKNHCFPKNSNNSIYLSNFNRKKFLEILNSNKIPRTIRVQFGIWNLLFGIY